MIDSGGALRVGPRSAGAQPGPACYGVGTELTVTDANLLLGRLDPTYFFGGRMSLDIERANIIASIRAVHPKARIVAFAQYTETVSMLFRRLAKLGGVAMLTARGARVARRRGDGGRGPHQA